MVAVRYVCGWCIAGNRGFEFCWQHGYSSLECVVCYEGSGLCDELITHAEESSWVCLSNCEWSRDINTEAAWGPTWAVAPPSSKKGYKDVAVRIPETEYPINLLLIVTAFALPSLTQLCTTWALITVWNSRNPYSLSIIGIMWSPSSKCPPLANAPNFS